MRAQPIDGFYGRLDELRLLRQVCLEEKDVPYFVVAGMPGVGKTSLVRQFVASEAAGIFRDGAAWLNGAKLSEELHRVAVRFGWQSADVPSTSESIAAWLANELRDRRVLLVLDSVPEKTSPQLIPSVSGKFRVVITTHLTSFGKNLGLRRVVTIPVDRWNVASACAYFRRAIPGLVVSNADLEEIAKHVGGLPLALRLLVRRLEEPNTSAAKLIDLLQRKPLHTIDRAAREFDRSVQETFSLAIRDLEAVELRVLVACAVCAQGTTTAVVAATADLPEDDTDEVLSDLTDRGLVEFESGTQRPWGLHDLIRLFLERCRDLPRARARHLEYLKSRAVFTDTALIRWRWNAAEEDVPEVIAEADHALRVRNGDLALELFLSVAFAMIRQNQEVEYSRRLRELLPMVSSLSARHALHAVLGELCGRADDDVQVIQFLQKALQLSLQLGKPEWACSHLVRLGVAVEKSRPPEAERYFREALKVMSPPRVPVLYDQAIAAERLGNLLRSKGDEVQARAMFSLAIAFHAASADERVAEGVRLPASLFLAIGSAEAAHQAARWRLKILMESGCDDTSIGQAAANLGLILRDIKLYSDAVDPLKTATECYMRAHQTGALAAPFFALRGLVDLVDEDSAENLRAWCDNVMLRLHESGELHLVLAAAIRSTEVLAGTASDSGGKIAGIFESVRRDLIADELVSQGFTRDFAAELAGDIAGYEHEGTPEDKTIKKA